MDLGVSVIVPAYNEIDSMRENLFNWIQFCESNNWKLIVVDDGSSEDTARVLEQYLHREHFEAYSHKVNRGYGSALRTGLSIADTTIAITMDADGQHSIESAMGLINYMIKTDSDMVVGSRKKIRERNLYRRLGKFVIRRITHILFTTTIHDLNSGFKAYKSEFLKPLLPFTPDSMAFSDIVTLLHLQSGLRVTEYPIEVKPREGGTSTINTMTAFQTVMEILNVVMWFSPSRVFLPIAAALFTLGFFWAVPFLIRGRGLSTTALLFMISGIIGFMLVLLAEQLASIRRSQLPRFGPKRRIHKTQDSQTSPPPRK